MTALPLIGLSTYQRAVRFSSEARPFTGLTRPYIEAVRAAGGLPVLLPHGASAGEAAALIGRLDGLLLTGGEDVEPAVYGEETLPGCGEIDRGRDELELALAREAMEQNRPVLAICRGLQVLNVALGGTLWQDLPSQVPSARRHSYYGQANRNRLAHTVRLAPDSRIAAALGTQELGTNSSHHQAIRELAAGLQVAGMAQDGVIEAIEAPDHRFAIGLQWHPEGMYEMYPVMLRPFVVLVEAAGGQ